MYKQFAARCLQIPVPVWLFIPSSCHNFGCVSSDVSGGLSFSKLQNRGISVAIVSAEDVAENNLLKGTYSFVFGSPKSFLQNYMLRSNVYEDRTFSGAPLLLF